MHVAIKCSEDIIATGKKIQIDVRTCNEIAIVHAHNLIIYLKASVETTYSGKLSHFQ